MKLTLNKNLIKPPDIKTTPGIKSVIFLNEAKPSEIDRGLFITSLSHQLSDIWK
jgi:hypothetical protein